MLTKDEIAALRKLAEREYMKDYGYLAEGQAADPAKESSMRFWDAVFVKLGGRTHYGPDELASDRTPRSYNRAP